MAAKLPLNVRKALRDLEPKITEATSALESIFGSGVKFEFDADATFAALEGHKEQLELPRLVIAEYLQNAVTALKNSSTDALVKDAFVELWPTKIITFAIVPDAYDAKKSGDVAGWNGYNGLRLKDNKLEIITRPASFGFNMGDLRQMTLARVLENAPATLTMAQRVQLRDTEKERADYLARIAKALNVDAATCDLEADIKAIKPLVEQAGRWKSVEPVEGYNRYLKYLALMLERVCADDLIQEAVGEVFTGKKVSLVCVPLMSKLKGDGKVVDNGYNGIQFKDGNINILCQPGTFDHNAANLENINITTLF